MSDQFKFSFDKAILSINTACQQANFKITLHPDSSIGDLIFSYQNNVPNSDELLLDIVDDNGAWFLKSIKGAVQIGWNYFFSIASGDEIELVDVAPQMNRDLEKMTFSLTLVHADRLKRLMRREVGCLESFKSVQVECRIRFDDTSVFILITDMSHILGTEVVEKIFDDFFFQFFIFYFNLFIFCKLP